MIMRFYIELCPPIDFWKWLPWNHNSILRSGRCVRQLVNHRFKTPLLQGCFLRCISPLDAFLPNLAFRFPKTGLLVEHFLIPFTCSALRLYYNCMIHFNQKKLTCPKEVMKTSFCILWDLSSAQTFLRYAQKRYIFLFREVCLGSLRSTFESPLLVDEHIFTGHYGPIYNYWVIPFSIGFPTDFQFTV